MTWITYTNRKQKKYFLTKGSTKNGGIKYFFSLKNTGTLCKEIPDGYEVYEHPASGQVFLKKNSDRKVTDLEKEVLEKLVKELSDVDAFIVDASRNMLSIYTINTDLEGIMEHFDLNRAKKMRDFLITNSEYSADLRFVLVDENKRIFQAERYVYLSRIDDWRTIKQPDRLEALAQSLLPHLGQESMFELIP